MNKKEAKEQAARIVCDLIEKAMTDGKFVFVYDEYSDDGLPGRRLSKNDRGRVEDALCDIQAKMDKVGLDRYIKRLPGRSTPADGKPGPRLKAWKEGSYFEKT